MATGQPDSAPFQLSCVLHGHSQDVRALAAIDADTIVSASRDRTVIVWQRLASGSPKFVQKAAFSGHSHFVNSVAVARPSSQFQNGLVYSGGSDKIIYGFEPSNTEEAVFTLTGHTDNVCALNVGESGDLISGSWDKTAKVWRNGVEILTLRGHEHAVWSVLVVEQDTYLTASADKTIKLWKGAKCTHTFTGHSDVVRGLTLIPGMGFASVSNDGTIRVWSLSGETIGELHGHTSFVYCVDRLSSSELVSSGEDRTVRVWTENGLKQTLTQPCVSVWCVAAIPNGDIVAGGSDGVVRIFSRAPERRAEADVIKGFDESLAASAIPSNQVGDVNKDKLPGLDALNVMGDKDGQVKMVRVGDIVEAHQWSAAQLQWVKIGEVVDAIGGSRKKMFAGKEYDFVFDVDVQEGAPPLKLPFNTGDNPFQAAQEFIHRNEIPQAYLDQIADFIIKNAGVVTLGEETASSSYADPFTGPSRYVPGGSASRPAAPAPAPISPWSSQPAPAKPQAPAKLIPMKGYSFFKVINFKGVQTKLLQINGELEKSMDYGELALKQDEQKHLERLIAGIEAGKLAGFDAADNKLLTRLAFEWPAASRFPGIDLLRMTVLHTSFPLQAGKDLVGSVLRAADLPVADGADVAKAQETNAMLVVRTLANMFARADLVESLRENAQKIVDSTRGLVRLSGNKNMRVALATLYLNITVLLRSASAGFDDALGVDLIEILCEMLASETDGEALFRELVAAGTLLASSASVREAAKLLDLASAVARMRRGQSDTEPRLRQAEAELAALLAA
ncbi:WD repeat protein Lub1 [Polyrhizophydium stewartii]|uniref:WD repeat protein Lub1 n=1 Tax=Polyrhizophydium stewartii TaxID=2732419 RepID=A0ABR4NHD7_9FUNG